MAIIRRPGHITYTGWDRIDVEVLTHDHDGKRWVPGELRSWDQTDDGTWTAIVTYTTGTSQNHIGRFNEAAIRKA